MPIKPANRHHYKGRAWKELRERILVRARRRCEFCFLQNGVTVWRAADGRPFDDYPPAAGWNEWLTMRDGRAPREPHKLKVVLTIAHINQDPTDNRDVNLRALCQRCHNLVDLPYRTVNAAATRALGKRIEAMNKDAAIAP